MLGGRLIRLKGRRWRGRYSSRESGRREGASADTEGGSETKALKGESYEGAEALLMAVSIGFTKKWHEALMEKLFALGGTMEDDEEEEKKGTTT